MFAAERQTIDLYEEIGSSQRYRQDQDDISARRRGCDALHLPDIRHLAGLRYRLPAGGGRVGSDRLVYVSVSKGGLAKP